MIVKENGTPTEVGHLKLADDALMLKELNGFLSNVLCDGSWRAAFGTWIQTPNTQARVLPHKSSWTTSWALGKALLRALLFGHVASTGRLRRGSQTSLTKTTIIEIANQEKKRRRVFKLRITNARQSHGHFPPCNISSKSVLQQ